MITGCAIPAICTSGLGAGREVGSSSSVRSNIAGGMPAEGRCKAAATAWQAGFGRSCAAPSEACTLARLQSSQESQSQHKFLHAFPVLANSFCCCGVMLYLLRPSTPPKSCSRRSSSLLSDITEAALASGLAAGARVSASADGLPHGRLLATQRAKL